MQLKNILYSLLLVFASNVAFAGGGWPQPGSHGYFKLSQWFVIANQHFTDSGRIDPNTTNGIFNTSLYAEYGFTDRITGILNFPFYSRAYFNNTISGTTGELIVPGEAINSIGDTDIGFKYGLIVNKPFVLSASIILGLPLGNDNGGTAGNLQTGDGEFNQLIQLDLGTTYKLGSQNFYANVYAGFNNRSNGFSDEIRWGIETGTNLFNNKLSVIARIVAITSLKNGDSTDTPNSTSIFANNTEFISFAPEVAYNVNDTWGFSASVGTAFYGRIIFANPSYSFGVFMKI